MALFHIIYNNKNLNGLSPNRQSKLLKLYDSIICIHSLPRKNIFWFCTLIRNHLRWSCRHSLKKNENFLLLLFIETRMLTTLTTWMKILCLWLDFFESHSCRRRSVSLKNLNLEQHPKQFYICKKWWQQQQGVLGWIIPRQ